MIATAASIFHSIIDVTIMLITCINHDFDFLSCLAPQTSKGSEAPRAKEEPYQGVAGKGKKDYLACPLSICSTFFCL